MIWIAAWRKSATLASLLVMCVPSAAKDGNAGVLKPDARRGPASLRPAARLRVQAFYARLPLRFEALPDAEGTTASCRPSRTPHPTAYTARGFGYSLRLSPVQTEFAFLSTGPDRSDDVRIDLLGMRLAGANTRARMAGERRFEAKSSYFLGSDPSQWRIGVEGYERLRVRQVYPGIDIVYYGSQQQLEYDFRVAPGADPGRIRLAFTGARALALGPDGGLAITLPHRTIRWKQPTLYQEVDGTRRPITGRFALVDGGLVGFRIASYDPHRALVIDPTLIYSTLIHGSNPGTQALGVAVDSSNMAYMVGYTSDPTFPSTTGVTAPGGTSAFICKFNTALSGSASLIYSTYIGGNATNVARNVAVDGSGNAYVVGDTTSTNFPVTSDAFQSKFKTGRDVFVAKVNSTATRLLYSTYLGGSGLGDYGNGIAVDSTGKLVAVGQTASTTFPVTTGAYQMTSSGAIAGVTVGFAVRINTVTTGSGSVIYSTYLNAKSGLWAEGVALDSSGGAYVVGYTNGGFATTTGAYQTSFTGTTGASVAFLAMLNPTGTALGYGTYFGPNTTSGTATGNMRGLCIALDTAADAYIGGETNSDYLAVTTNAYQAARSGLYDGFVTKFNPTGSALLYSTYLGGTQNDDVIAVALDAVGHLWAVGSSTSTDFPVTSDAVQTTSKGGGATTNGYVFVSELDPSGSRLLYSTYLGGTSNPDNVAYAVAIDSLGRPIVVGAADSATFQTTSSNAYQSASWTSRAAFLAQFSINNPFDLNGDGKFDLIWQDPSTGQVVYWIMNGFSLVSKGTIATGLPPEWRIVAVADMNHNGSPDLIWQHSVTGGVVFWPMTGVTWSGTYTTIVSNGPSGWRVVGAADVTGDGQPDLIWQNSTSGAVTYWKMSGATFTGTWGTIVTSAPSGWKVVGVADVTGDGYPDLIWQSPDLTTVTYYELRGVTWTGVWGYIVQSVPPGWQVVGVAPVVNNVNPDLLWRNTTTGVLTYYHLNHTTYTGSWGTIWAGQTNDWLLASPH